MKALFVALALFAPATYAQEFGDWTVERLKNKSAIYAATMNDSGGILGKTCDQEGCIWVLTAQTTCESGHKYPALLASSVGAGHIHLQCAPNETTPGRFIVEQFDMLDGAVKSGETLAIAMPLDSGQFRVSRFGIRGWASASSALASRVKVMLSRPGERNL